MITPENAATIAEAIVEQLKKQGADSVVLSFHFPNPGCKCGKDGCGATIECLDGEPSDLAIQITGLLKRVIPDPDKRAIVLRIMLEQAYSQATPKPHQMRQRGAHA